MAQDAHAEPAKSNPLHLILFLTGGLCTGVGLLNLYWSFGDPETALNQDFYTVGFNGLDNITALQAADYSIPLLVVGVLLLVYANAIAWQKTGGY